MTRFRVGGVLFLWVGVACGDSETCVGPGCGPAPPQVQGPYWDTDGDSISNATEIHPPNAIYGFRPDTADVNPSRARGIPTAGSIDSAINLPDDGAMYVHHWGNDAQQTDDWGILTLLNVIAGAGRRFEIPLGFGGSCRVYTEWTAFPRMQVGDLSLQNGGQFGVCNGGGHCSHQNGVDVDIRYLRLDAQEVPLNLASADSVQFDIDRTVDLLWCFMSDPRVELVYYDSIRTGIVDINTPPVLLHFPGHSDHFHVRIRAY